MPIPFDSLCLAAAISEMQPWIGSRVQHMLEPDERTLVIGLYLRGEAWLLLSTHPRFSRSHLIGRRPKSDSNPSPFQAELKRRLNDGRLTRASQRGFDRILELEFSTAEGTYTLIAELISKHANLMLLDESQRIVAAQRWLGSGKSKRLVLPNRRYEPPPFPLQRPIWEAGDSADLRNFEGASPFLIRLLQAGGLPGSLGQLRRCVETSSFHPVLVEGEGVYPITVAPVLVNEQPQENFSGAAEAWYGRMQLEWEIEQQRHSLQGQLERVLLARDVALNELHQAADTAARARELQEKGELILTHQRDLAPDATLLDTTDYAGAPIAITVDPNLTAVENAERYFQRAKRAKRGAEGVHAKIEALESDRTSLRSVLKLLQAAQSHAEIAELQREADLRRWLHHQPLPTRTKEERPYQGHSIRETFSPGGWKVLYGENATSNDYLTLRVAKPNDWWLHVRGAPSAHVVVVTANQPEKVQREDLMFAAQLAVRHSPSKHSKYVPVDYCLKKYVRKPRSSAPGAALYEREKTLFVD